MTLAMAFAVAACGDDDPILPPTPDPAPEPEPTPEVVYNGSCFMFQLDSVAGDAKAFYALVADSMKLHFPELKEVSDGSYAYSLVYEKEDTTELSSIRAKYRAFMHSMVNVTKSGAITPVVTSSMTFATVSESNVKQDWSSSFSGASSSNTFGILIPSLKAEEWKTDDDKGTGVKSVTFDSWMRAETLKATYNSSNVKVGDTSYSASRRGQLLILFDEDGQIKYGFYIASTGDTLSLVRVGENTLEGEAIPTYSVVAE